MKIRETVIGLVSLLVLGGCSTTKGTHYTPPIQPPSTSAVKSDINRADTHVVRASESSAKLHGRLQSTQDYAKRIDNKAIIILENWQ